MNEHECAGCPLKIVIGTAAEICHRLRKALPAESAEHLEKAARELLLAARALVEAGLEQKSRTDSPGTAPERIQVN